MRDSDMQKRNHKICRFDCKKLFLNVKDDSTLCILSYPR